MPHKTYFNETAVRWNNNLHWDALIGFERLFEAGEGSFTPAQTSWIFTCSFKVHTQAADRCFNLRWAHPANQDARRLWAFLRCAFTSCYYHRKCDLLRSTSTPHHHVAFQRPTARPLISINLSLVAFLLIGAVASFGGEKFNTALFKCWQQTQLIFSVS